ncbi:DNA-binding protein [Pseudomonas sp. NPDC086581]|uniref:DNA-binding protein n=1 Tax=Pseudomonas sp. NPDC086581 TaxID=3364432 RepID=UPI0037FA2E45
MAGLTLQMAAHRLGMRRPELVSAMRRAGLLDHLDYPLRPDRDGAHLYTHQGTYSTPYTGTRSSYSTRVKESSLRWLAEKIGRELPMPEAQPDRRAGDA